MYFKLNLLVGLLCYASLSVAGDQLSADQIRLRDKFITSVRLGWQLRCVSSFVPDLQKTRALLQQEIEKLRDDLTAVESKQAYQAAHAILQTEHSDVCSCDDHK